mgnify:CR=1 FL=1
MFWRKKKSENQLRQERLQEESRRAVEAGGIPVIAEERLKNHVASGSKFFTSDLSTREFLLARDQNLIPIGQVMGTSFFNINFWNSIFRVRLFTGEMKAVSNALLDARQLAMQRLRQEASLLNASGVIGVKIQAGRRTWSDSLREFTAVGTAVKIPGWKHEPFLCDLSGQEFWQLYSAGYRPVDIAFGVSSYYMRQDWKTSRQMYQWWGGTNFNNQEIDLFTQGFYNARQLACERLERDLETSGADGMVGVEIDYDFERIETSDNSQAWDLVLNFTALGTGIVEDPELREQAKAIARPKFCINLRDTKLASTKTSRMNELKSKSMESVEEAYQRMLDPEINE